LYDTSIIPRFELGSKAVARPPRRQCIVGILRGSRLSAGLESRESELDRLIDGSDPRHGSDEEHSALHFEIARRTFFTSPLRLAVLALCFFETKILCHHRDPATYFSARRIRTVSHFEKHDGKAAYISDIICQSHVLPHCGSDVRESASQKNRV
jgi:hypothetical protein